MTADHEPVALLIHPDERIEDIVRALKLVGYGVFPRADGRHYVAAPWRIEAERRRREHEERRAQMTPDELAADDATQTREHRVTAEMSRS